MRRMRGKEHGTDLCIVNQGAKCAQGCVEGDSVHPLRRASSPPAKVALAVEKQNGEMDLAKATAETRSQEALV